MIKLKEVLAEARELDPKVISTIAKLTDRNNHNGARGYLAMAMKNRKLDKAYKAIETLNMALGHMPQELIKLRIRLDKELFKQSYKTYSNYKDIVKAF